jgi:metallo-beta-lactamase family protein
MCTGGRIKHHLSINIGRPESTILFVGYQAEDTLGRQIVDGSNQVRIFGRMLPVKAQIRQVQGLSAHADRTDLLDWLGRFKRGPRKLMLTHGEASAAEALAGSIRERFGWDVAVPEYRERMQLGQAPG